MVSEQKFQRDSRPILRIVIMAGSEDWNGKCELFPIPNTEASQSFPPAFMESCVNSGGVSSKVLRCRASSYLWIPFKTK